MGFFSTVQNGFSGDGSSQKYMYFIVIAIVLAIAYWWFYYRKASVAAPAAEASAVHDENPMFVLYYANWCPASQHFLPIWEQFKAEVAVRGWKLDVNELDCVDKNAAICSAYSIRQYPTMVLYHHGVEHVYQGERDAGKMTAFVSQICGY